MAETVPSPDAPAPRPFWIPENVKFDTLPRARQVAITEIINPLYRELVLEAPALEKTAGLTVVHMTWLEIIQQFELGKGMIGNAARGPSTATLQDWITQHLRLAAEKSKILKTLLQVKAFTQKYPKP